MSEERLIASPPSGASGGLSCPTIPETAAAERVGGDAGAAQQGAAHPKHDVWAPNDTLEMHSASARRRLAMRRRCVEEGEEVESVTTDGDGLLPFLRLLFRRRSVTADASTPLRAVAGDETTEPEKRGDRARDPALGSG